MIKQGLVCLFLSALAFGQCAAKSSGPGTVCIGPLSVTGGPPSAIVLSISGVTPPSPQAGSVIISVKDGIAQESDDGQAYYSLKGKDGIDGTAASIVVNTVTTLPPGSAAYVTNAGNSSNAFLDFGIPQGAKGDKGDAATIAINSVTTLPPGTPAYVNNVGTLNAAQFNIGIPQGQQGAMGPNWTTCNATLTNFKIVTSTTRTAVLKVSGCK